MLLLAKGPGVRGEEVLGPLGKARAAFSGSGYGIALNPIHRLRVFRA